MTELLPDAGCSSGSASLAPGEAEAGAVAAARAAAGGSPAHQTTPDWPTRLRRQRTRTARARKFPANTCPASRHVHLIANSLLDPKRKHKVEEIWEADHMANSILSVLESLWKARTKIAKMEAARAR